MSLLAVHWKLFAFVTVSTLVVVVVTRRAPEPWDAHLAAMEAKLEAAWHARHPGPPLPEACERDEVHAGELEIDASPGHELVIGSDRLGIAMFAASNELLAFHDPTGYRDGRNWWFNQVLQGGDDFGGLVIREEVATGKHRCRSTRWAELLRRRGDTLVSIARYREDDADQCAWSANTGPSVFRLVTHAEPNPNGVSLRVVTRGKGDEVITQNCFVGGGWVSGECRFLVEK